MRFSKLLFIFLLCSRSVNAQQKLVGPLTISAPATTSVPMTIRAVVGQTAHLQDWKDSLGNVNAFVDYDGSLHAPVAISGLTPGKLVYANTNGQLSSAPIALDASTDNITFLANNVLVNSGMAIGKRTLVGLLTTDVAGGSIVAQGAIQSVTASANASVASITAIAGSGMFLASGKTGSGTYLPMGFYVSGSEATRIETSGRVLMGFTSSDVSGGSLVAAHALQVATASANASVGALTVIGGSYVAMSSGKTGSGTALPIAFFNSATESASFDGTNDATNTAMLLFYNGSLTRVRVRTCVTSVDFAGMSTTTATCLGL